MEQVIRQLLDFSRQSQIRPRSVKLAQVARSAVAAMEPESDRLNVSVALSGKSAESMEADSVQMEQALADLLKNAIQAASPDGHVKIGWQLEDNQAVFQVEDSGPGIDEQSRKKLFEPFFTTRPVGEGTGLGLAVVHGIIEAHGGSIDVKASPLGGACFKLMLPVKELLADTGGIENA